MTVLDKIIEEKRRWLAAKKIAFPQEKFLGNVKKSDRDFYAAMRKSVPAFILECKKASPSKGLIRADFDPAEIARVYKNYAAAVSVLCDEPFFQGRFENIPLVRAELSQPVLAKEFIIDEYQIFLARFYGADAILLMLSVLSEKEYLALAAVAHSLGMGVLTEVSTPEEAAIAKRVGAKVIGINNRNLRDLSTDVSRTREMANLVRGNGVTIVAESGIFSHSEILDTLPFANAFLIGTSLMRERDLDKACRRLLLGENKVCGLTRVEDAQAALDAGAVFGGLIFAEKSPRKISRERARQIIESVPALDYVAVVQNQSIEEILDLTGTLRLHAVQLHGNEDANFVKELRQRLPARIGIWKAVSLSGGAFPQDFSEENLDGFVFDSGNGGTGTVFDWTKIPTKLRSRALLAGGISQENVRAAHRVGCLGLDINSGAEISPGIKSSELLRKIFAGIKQF